MTEKITKPVNCINIDGFKVELIARLIEEPLWYTTPAESVKGLFELSDLIELVCFYDKIYYPKWVSSLVSNSKFFKLLENESIIVATSEINNQILANNILKQNEDIILTQFKKYESINQEKLFLSSIDCYIRELSTGLPFYPSICYSQLYFNWIKIKDSLKLYNSVYRAYKEVVKKTMNDLFERDMLAGSVKSFYIPPLTEFIFSKVNYPSELIYEILEWRNKFEKPRKFYEEICSIARDKNISNSKFKKEKQKLDHALALFLKDLSRNNNSDCRMQVIGSQALSGVDLNNIIDGGFNINDFRLNSMYDILLKKALENVFKIWRTRQIKIFFTIKKKFKNLQNDLAIINKPWKDTPINFTPELMKFGFDLLKEIENIWHYKSIN